MFSAFSLVKLIIIDEFGSYCLEYWWGALCDSRQAGEQLKRNGMQNVTWTEIRQVKTPWDTPQDMYSTVRKCWSAASHTMIRQETRCCSLPCWMYLPRIKEVLLLVLASRLKQTADCFWLEYITLSKLHLATLNLLIFTLNLPSHLPHNTPHPPPLDQKCHMMQKAFSLLCFFFTGDPRWARKQWSRWNKGRKGRQHCLFFPFRREIKKISYNYN